MSTRHHVRKDEGSKSRPTENELHLLFGKLAELVDMTAESRHIETMEAYYIINRIINLLES